MVEAKIGDDAVDPGIERALEPEAPQVAISLKEGFLVDVLGVVFRGGQPQRQSQNCLVVLAHQLLEGGAVPALRLTDQDAIV